jgi:hypothetical protein
MSRKIIFTSILVLLLLAAAFLPSPARAVLATLTITPNTAVNNVPTSITIGGDGFVSGATVTLSPGGAILTSNVDSSTSISATVPSGLTPGVYDVTVTNPDLSSITQTSGLTILAPTPTFTPTLTATASATPTPTPPFNRPQVVVDTYWVVGDSVRSNQQFSLMVRLKNAGGLNAYGLQAAFISSDLLMLQTGGVVAGGELDKGLLVTLNQPMISNGSLYGKGMVNVEMSITYYDEHAQIFSEKFSLVLPVTSSGSQGGYIAPTATPTGSRRSQLVINEYRTDLQPLQPGDQFTLSITVQNVGRVAAKSVTMIIGGGTSSGSGTPQAGVSGSGGEFTNFAPLGSSNVKSLGDITAGAVLTASQRLVVNVSTNPGAYPLKISFTYLDEQNNAFTDDQVITLLVYRLPTVNISFYVPVQDLIQGQPNALPFQVVNLGRGTAVLGKMTVTTDNGTIENGEMLVGSLDPGGYFTLDAVSIPEAAGALKLTVTIDYVDDFNQPRQILTTIPLKVTQMVMEPTPAGGLPGGNSGLPSSPEGFGHKLWRFLLGLLGLDSGMPSGEIKPLPTEVPVPLGPGVKG